MMNSPASHLRSFIKLHTRNTLFRVWGSILFMWALIVCLQLEIKTSSAGRQYVQSKSKISTPGFTDENILNLPWRDRKS